MLFLVIAMFLGSLDLAVNFYQLIISPDPHYLLIKVEELYYGFSTILIIVVGYELFKSMILILNHDKIPVKSILKIACIALANKIITLNIKTVDLNVMMGVSMLIAAVGIAFFFFNKDNEKED